MWLYVNNIQWGGTVLNKNHVLNKNRGWGEQNSILYKPQQILAKGGLGGPFQALPETKRGWFFPALLCLTNNLVMLLCCYVVMLH